MEHETMTFRDVGHEGQARQWTEFLDEDVTSALFAILYEKKNNFVWLSEALL